MNVAGMTSYGFPPYPFQPQPRPESPASLSDISTGSSSASCSTAQAAESKCSTKTTKGRRARVVWNPVETHILIEIWGGKYSELKCASNSLKTKIWSEIVRKFEDGCRKNNLDYAEKTAEQIKKRISNLEYEYRQIRTKMTQTGQEGAKKLQANFPFYDDLDNVLGCRDAANPDLMSIENTSVLPENEASAPASASTSENDNNRTTPESSTVPPAPADKAATPASSSKKAPRKRRICLRDGKRGR